ncbi:MAG: redoxin domain-containing protein [Verrucomicrobiaceae bacterium]|nr:redoxin domain-containing protein [Verrucomicrobiaceae bacterium]
MSRSPLAAITDPGKDYLDSFSMLAQRIREGNSFSGNERNCAFLNRRDGSFVDMSYALGLDHPDDSRGIAITDFDGDGDPDICMTNRTAPRLRLLRNDLSAGNRWLSLRLEGDPSKRCPRDAIGARVTVSVGSQNLHRTVVAGDGFLSQSGKKLFFGLGAKGDIQSVQVRWPAGETEKFRGISPGGVYVIRQGSGVALKSQNVRPTVSFAPGEPEIPEGSGVRRIRLSQPLKLPASMNFTNLEGNNVTIGSLVSGAPLLINLWATWCAPCLVELGQFGQKAGVLEEAGIRVLALCVDGIEDGKRPDGKQLRELLQRTGFSGMAGHAGKSLVNVLDQLVLEAVYRHHDLPVPCSFLVDKGGWLTVIYKGEVSMDTLVSDRRKLGGGPDVARREAMPFAGIWADKLLATHPVAVSSAYREGGYDDDAREYLMEFLSDHPVVPGQQLGARQSLQLADAHFNIGDILSGQGDHRGAVSHFKAAARFNPQSARMRSRQILATAELGDTELAKDLARKMNNEQPNNPDRLTLLADILVLAGEKGEAINTYNAVLKINPRTIPAINSLAWIHATATEDGLRDGARAVELAEFLMNAPGARENPDFLMTLAAAHAETGNITKASSAVRQAVAHARQKANEGIMVRLEEVSGKILKGQPVRD